MIHVFRDRIENAVERRKRPDPPSFRSPLDIEGRSPDFLSALFRVIRTSQSVRQQDSKKALFRVRVSQYGLKYGIAQRRAIAVCRGVMASVAYATTPVNGITSPSPTETEEFYTQLLRLRDVVLSGKHASFKLPSSAIERLKTSLTASDAQAAESQQSLLTGAINDTAFTTNQSQLQQPSSFPSLNGLPGIQASSETFASASTQVYGAKPPSAAGFHPIFLEKSDSLVRAEGQLKRQRLDHDLQAQVEQRKHSSRDKDPGAEAPSPVDIDSVLLSALERVKPVSGVREAPKSGASSSFDENDYYSSQVQSDWSSEASSSKASDKAAGAFTADFERLNDASAPSASVAKRSLYHKEPSISGASLKPPSKDRRHVYTDEPDGAYEIADEDDEYTPPDATAFDSFRDDGAGEEMGQETPPDDDNSEYEPGEITDNNIPIPQYQVQPPAQLSPRVPIIRNHLTHLAAPQPNRVSPLATAKGPSIELELVNGRPEVVQKPQNHYNNVHSRASTASPSNNGVGGSGKKRRNKKRKRDAEPSGRAKRRRERQAVLESHVPPTYDEPYIKDEPVSPPPFANVRHIPPYGQPQEQQHTAQIDLVSPRRAPLNEFPHNPPRSALRYEQTQPASPGVARVMSPATHRPLQRDNQDLRRVASLHYAQLPHAPQHSRISPVAPYRTASMTYGDPRMGQSAPPPPEERTFQPYQDQARPESGYYMRSDLSRSPPQSLQYRDQYAARAPSPAMMPPPAAPPRKIIVDQNGNRYYAAEAVPAPSPVAVHRHSMAPLERRSQHDISYEHTPTDMGLYSQQHSTPSGQYAPADSRMAPPSQHPRRQPAPEQYIPQEDANGYQAQDYNARRVDPIRYAEANTSPVYQSTHGYERPPPPQQQPREPTSPVYVPSRSYSVRPDETSIAQPSYLRHASVAPAQYDRQEAPSSMRAYSVMPSSEYGALAAQQQQPQRTYSQAPQGVRYVDQYGNEVFPREVREVRY